MWISKYGVVMDYLFMIKRVVYRLPRTCYTPLSRLVYLCEN